MNKNSIIIVITNVLFTAISLLVALPFSAGLCELATDVFRDAGFASYLNTITPQMLLFAFLYFAFDGIYATLRFYHLRERTLFIEKRTCEVMLFPEAMRVLVSPEFLAEAALCAAACFYFEGFGALHFALLASVCVLRKAAVHRRWYITRKAYAPKRLVLVLLRNLGLLIMQIWLFIIIIPVVFPYLWIVITKFEFFANVTALALIIFFSCIYARAMKKRNDFIKSLRSLCTEKGFELSEIKNRYSFIFGRQSGANFTVTAHGKTYSCKFIAAKIKFIPMILRGDGEGNFLYVFQIRGIKLLNKRTYFEYGFNAPENERKILICSPMPAKMSIEENGRALPAESGAHFWEYRLFAASNFLRCLEWNAVEK